MTYPWASGEVLTAADLNAYAGLVLVSNTTIGTAVSSVTVSSAFSSTFDNYRVVINIDSASADTGGRVYFGASSANGHYGSLYYDQFTGTSTATARTSNGANIDVGLIEIGNTAVTSFDVQMPFLVKKTYVHGTYYGRGYAGWFGGVHNVDRSNSTLTYLPASGTLTGGTIKVYGYNNG